MLVAAAYALFVGALSLRTRGVYFIMVTLAFAQMAYFVFHDTKLGGGSDGIFLYVPPGARHRQSLARPGEQAPLLLLALAALALTYALLALVLRSRFGHALAGIRVNEQRMRAAGFRTYGYKLAAFVIAGAFAGLAGFLVAAKDAAVNPELLSWHESGAVLLMIILGGLGHLRGAFIGAVAFTLLKELFQSEALLGPLASHWQLTLGLTIIAFVALVAQGPDRRGPNAAPVASRAGHGKPPMNEDIVPLMQATRLTRRFGGLTAVNEVSLALRVGQIHAVIGTNGAGKTTLINMLSGEMPATERPCCWRAPTSPRGRSPQALARRHRAQLSAHDDLPGAQRARELPPQRAGRTTAPWRSGSPPQAARTARRRARCARTRRAWRRRRASGRHAEPWRRSASSRSRCAWPRARGCCCSTSRWPAWAPRKPTACCRCSKS